MAGIYIHIPFCHQACTYCNFHFSTSVQKKASFIEALLTEIGLHDFPDNDSGPINSIYFGGGTPSILDTTELTAVLNAIKAKYTIAPDAEITLEANPDDIDPEKLQEWLLTGINRLSVGIQTFHPEELIWMNRSHNATDSLRCIDEIKSSGFSNYSIDLIYGSPLQTNEILDDNLNRIFSYAIPHISCYALTVEPKTTLQKLIRDQQAPAPDSAHQAAQFLHIMNRMKEAGYVHYEISNYALPGMQSRHNSSYWQGLPYLGLGPSAHSYDGKRTRSWNIANNSLYIQSIQHGSVPSEKEILTDNQMMNEYVMTAVRTMEGIDLSRISRDFGEANRKRIQDSAEQYTGNGYMQFQENRLILTNEGKLFADGIAADLFI